MKDEKTSDKPNKPGDKVKEGQGNPKKEAPGKPQSTYRDIPKAQQK